MSEEHSSFLKKADERVLLLTCQQGAQVNPINKVPLIEHYEVKQLPPKMIPFNQAVCKTCTDYEAIVHYFIHDALFMRFFYEPQNYVEKLR